MTYVLFNNSKRTNYTSCYLYKKICTNCELVQTACTICNMYKFTSRSCNLYRSQLVDNIYSKFGISRTAISRILPCVEVVSKSQQLLVQNIKITRSSTYRKWP